MKFVWDQKFHLLLPKVSEFEIKLWKQLFFRLQETLQQSIFLRSKYASIMLFETGLSTKLSDNG